MIFLRVNLTIFVISVEEDNTVFVDVEHSYCLPRSNSQESVETEKTPAVPSCLDHDYASSPLSPPSQPPPAKKTPLKDRNRIVNHHKVNEKDYVVEKKLVVLVGLFCLNNCSKSDSNDMRFSSGNLLYRLHSPRGVCKMRLIYYSNS